MGKTNFTAPAPARFRKARIVVGYPLNGGTAYHFSGASHYDIHTGEYLILEVGKPLPSNAQPIPVSDSIGFTMRQGIPVLIERLFLHRNIEICLIPYANSANTITPDGSGLYDGEYRFLSRTSLEELKLYIDQTPVMGSHNGGDFFRRAYHLLNETEKDGYEYYLLDIMPSPYTLSTVINFEEGAKPTKEDIFKFYLGYGDMAKMDTNRSLFQLFNNQTGKIDWDLYDSFENNYGVFTMVASKGNSAGTGAAIGNGVVDELSLGYAQYFAELISGLDVKCFHIVCDGFTPETQKAGMKSAFGISASDIGHIWFDAATSGEFLSAVNRIALSILEELRVG